MSSGRPAGQPLMKIMRLVLPGPGPGPAEGDVPRLCARLELLYGAGAPAVVCDASAVTAPGLASVEALARLRLTAGERPFWVTGAAPALRALLHLVGLVELLGEPEEREPPGGVEEGVETDDLSL